MYKWKIGEWVSLGCQLRDSKVQQHENKIESLITMPYIFSIEDRRALKFFRKKIWILQHLCSIMLFLGGCTKDKWHKIKSGPVARFVQTLFELYLDNIFTTINKTNIKNYGNVT